MRTLKNLRLIHRSKYFAVFELEDLGDCEFQCVLKIALDAKSNGLLSDEISVLKNLDGVPGVVQMLWHGKLHDREAILLPLLQKLPSKVPKKDVTAWSKTLCNTLRRVHRRGVIHRDIKPGNILLNANNQPVLIDFGVAVMDGKNGASEKFVGTQLLLLMMLCGEARRAQPTIITLCATQCTRCAPASSLTRWMIDQISICCVWLMVVLVASWNNANS